MDLILTTDWHWALKDLDEIMIFCHYFSQAKGILCQIPKTRYETLLATFENKK